MNSPPLSQCPGICFRRRLWHRLRMLRVLGFALAAMIALAAQTSATVADRIRVAVQRTGTLAWELDVIRTHGLDRKLDLAIETVELASTEAGKIALKGGSADLMLSDWLWVARERSLGDDLVFYPSSSTLGAVMVPARSPIREIIDLRGRKLAVAGGPLDKSWLLLQALARRSGLDLKKQTTVVYGAPPLLSEKALQGETDATLTFWNFCADLESKGLKRAIAMDGVMQGLGSPDEDTPWEWGVRAAAPGPAPGHGEPADGEHSPDRTVATDRAPARAWDSGWMRGTAQGRCRSACA